jgi:hypothetical protein
MYNPPMKPDPILLHSQLNMFESTPLPGYKPYHLKNVMLNASHASAWRQVAEGQLDQVEIIRMIHQELGPVTGVTNPPGMMVSPSKKWRFSGYTLANMGI